MSVEQQIVAWQLAYANGLPFVFRGLGRSMLPALHPDDEALFAPLDAPPRPGEILLFRAGDRLVAHRLLAVAADGRLCLRGDFMAADDPMLPADDVLGRLIAVRRHGRELRADRGRLALYAALWPRLHRRAPLAARMLRLAARVANRLAARLTPPGTQG